MASYSTTIESIDGLMENGKAHGIIHLSAENIDFSENTIEVSDQKMVNFGSCSYLSLESDERLKTGAIEAINKFGSQFSSSRAYISVGLYEELETLFNQIFGGHCIVANTTTLAHIAAIPVVVDDKDAVIIDHQAHNSLHTAVALLKPRKIHVELLRHNNMENLETRVKELGGHYKTIWYISDSVYSMYGDVCPLNDVNRLLNKYKQFSAYIDDAHGMTWCGKNGQGYVLSKIPLHERMVIATSLSKSFAVTGGLLVFPNKTIREKVRNCGGPLIFSGPLEPATLGAAIASAKIHLSPEIDDLQKALLENILYTKKIIEIQELPCVSLSDSPVFFIGVSLPKVAYAVIQRLMTKGHYVNIGMYPAVPMKNTGIRFTITRNHTKAQIKALLEDMKSILDAVLDALDFSYEKIYKAFRRDMPSLKTKEKIVDKKLIINNYKSIKAINKETWNHLFYAKGIIDYEALLLLETSFTNNKKREDNFDFDYIIIRDEEQNIILATFLTVSLFKEDMMNSREISAKIEKIREENPYYLTAEILSLGTPMTEGEQIYIDKNHPLWEKALGQLIEWMSKKQADNSINQIIVRDFENPHPRLEKVFTDNGYIKYKLPLNNYIDNFPSESDFMATLTSRSRRSFRAKISKNYDKFIIRENNTPAQEDVEHWRRLYLNVKHNNFTVNTFDLPLKVFSMIANSEDWRTIEFFPKKDFELEEYDNKSVAVGFVNINGPIANYALVGIDYKYQKAYRVYNCLLYHTIEWAKENNIERVNLGYTADREKKGVGAKQSEVYAFMQVDDDFNMRSIFETDVN